MKRRTSFEEQRGTRYIRGKVYLGIIIFNCFSSKKPCLRFLLICFARETKGFYLSSLWSEVDFRDMMNISLNILTKNCNLKKLRHSFVDERALITTTLIPPCHWKTFVPCCLLKKNVENLFLALIVNHRKIVQKNKLCHPKQQ